MIGINVRNVGLNRILRIFLSPNDMLKPRKFSIILLVCKNTGKPQNSLVKNFFFKRTKLMNQYQTIAAVVIVNNDGHRCVLTCWST